MGYKIMNRELTAYSLEGQCCLDYYESMKDKHISKDYICYGDVLVQTKSVFSGIQVTVSIYFRNHWYWKPSFHWKYSNYYFYWLFFMFWFNKKYIDKPEKVIKDHLAEFLNKTK